jgi:murein DD-endopeptidase MepM/ murein hydrolase activator NlpD
MNYPPNTELRKHNKEICCAQKGFLSWFYFVLPGDIKILISIYGIVIGHGEFTTVYIHVVPLINVGQYVKKGQIIAKIAKIKSYHLHFGIRLAKYDKYSTRGALPLKNTPGDKYCKGDPVFPGHFIDPFEVKYD